MIKGGKKKEKRKLKGSPPTPCFVHSVCVVSCITHTLVVPWKQKIRHRGFGFPPKPTHSLARSLLCAGPPGRYFPAQPSLCAATAASSRHYLFISILSTQLFRVLPGGGGGIGGGGGGIGERAHVTKTRGKTSTATRGLHRTPSPKDHHSLHESFEL